MAQVICPPSPRRSCARSRGGLTNRKITDQFVISEATVRTHVGNILSKLGLASRTQPALYVLREGIASLYDSETS